ncbi:MAG: tetratricopeptide repeat protein [Candidatus Brocadiaceae bacterium]|nr:tetratricopeptide repeat protein [Candidatus Brocadiaceae bacterium]
MIIQSAFSFGTKRLCFFLTLLFFVLFTSFQAFACDTSAEPTWELNTQETGLARTALHIARESYPEIDREHYLKRLNDIIERVRASLNNKKEPGHIIATINNVLFNELQFHYVQTGKLEHISLHKVLDTRTGNCVGLSILYLSIAEGLHLPMYGVSVPEHIFVRYDDGNFRQNIETGYKGMTTSDNYYINIPQKKISSISIKNGCYLKNLTTDEVIADIYLNRSILQKEGGNIEAALKDVNHAISLHGNDAVAYCNRGVIHETTGDIERAIDDYNKAVSLNPDYAPTYYNRGSMYAKMEQLDMAIMDYSMALSLDPDSKLAYLNRGIAFQMIGKKDLALNDLNKTITLDPAFAYAYSTRGLMHVESDKPEKALADFNKALELDPNHAETYMRRSILHADAQRFDHAIQDITTFIRFEPNNAFAYYIRAKAYRGKGFLELAIKDFDKMLEIKPRVAGVYYERSLSKNQLGMISEALMDLHKAIELFPYNPFAYLHRGNIFKKLGDNKNALLDYQTYLKLNPKAPDREEIEIDIECLEKRTQANWSFQKK